MNKWEIDVPVLLIFFARSETFEKVFEQVKKARPSTLLLWQDGPRENRPDDIEGIERCRKIAENIDWDCTVYRNYQEKNLGCDPSTHYAHRWAFETVEKCIVLEDDQMPSLSFFRYCKELLDKYENDERVNHICGYNVLGESKDCPYDYLFSYTGSGAWASWRRVAKGWDMAYSFLDNDYAIKNLRRKYNKKLFNERYERAWKRRKSGVAFWETIMGFDCMLNNRYAIIPKKNLVSNIGMTQGSTHSNAEVKLLSKEQQKIFNGKLNEIDFPLKHPDYVVPDFDYMRDMNVLMGNGTPFRNIFRKVIYIIKCIVYGKGNLLIAGIKRRLNRIFKK